LLPIFKGNKKYKIMKKSESTFIDKEEFLCNKAYTKLAKIRRETHGTVYKAQNNKTKEIFALKKIKTEENLEGVSSKTLREIVILKKMDHPNIIKLFNIEYGLNKIFFSFEFLPYDLEKYINEKYKQTGNNIPENQIKLIMFQLLSGLGYLHSKRVLHRDLKPKNILIDDKCNVKISEFGLSRVFSVPVRPYTNEISKKIL
jgi:serine/threonine protein kinase